MNGSLVCPLYSGVNIAERIALDSQPLLHRGLLLTMNFGIRYIIIVNYSQA